MNFKTDIVIVGTGAAGLYCALNFPGNKKILMITKAAAEESDSFWLKVVSAFSKARMIMTVF